MIFEPYDTILEAYSNLYPEAPVPEVHVQPLDTGALGQALFPDDGEAPVVLLDVDLSLAGACDILCHELAHIANPPGTEEDQHGPLWQAAYDAIVAEYLRLIEASGVEIVEHAISGAEGIEQGGEAYARRLQEAQP